MLLKLFRRNGRSLADNSFRVDSSDGRRNESGIIEQWSHWLTPTQTENALRLGSDGQKLLLATKTKPLWDKALENG